MSNVRARVSRGRSASAIGSSQWTFSFTALSHSSTSSNTSPRFISGCSSGDGLLDLGQEALTAEATYTGLAMVLTALTRDRLSR